MPYNNCNSYYNFNIWKNHLKVCKYKSYGIEQTSFTNDTFEWEEIQFFVKDINNKNHTFKLPLSTTVKELKEKLKNKTGINIEEMRLTYGAKEMQNEKMLEFYGIYNNSTITQLIRLKGGSYN